MIYNFQAEWAMTTNSNHDLGFCFSLRCTLWQYWLSRFQGRDAKLDIFWLRNNILKGKIAFLWVCGVLTKKLYDFLSLPWQLHKEYCHTIKTLGKTSKKSKFLCRNHFELHRWKKWNGCFYVFKIRQYRLISYIGEQTPHLLFPMFFNLMFKTTHFVFRQNRSVKVSKSQKQPMVSSILPKNEQRISALEV